MSSKLADPRPSVAAFPSSASVQGRIDGENFVVASALLGRTYARHLRAVYGFARLVDELGDSADGGRLALLEVLEEEVDLAFAGTPRHPLLQDLVETIRECGLPREPFVRLIEANRLDQTRPVYETFDDLVSYCELSANPVGELVLHVFGVATRDRVALSDDVCTALQLVEHWQDVGEDAARGRVYLPAEDRRRFGVALDDLRASTTSEPLRRLLAFESERAARYLTSGARLVATLRGRARIAVAGYVAGGRATLDALEACDYDVLRVRARASRRRRMRLSLLTWAGAL
jgi:squalene synthase HpnC